MACGQHVEYVLRPKDAVTVFGVRAVSRINGGRSRNCQAPRSPCSGECGNPRFVIGQRPQAMSLTSDRCVIGFAVVPPSIR